MSLPAIDLEVRLLRAIARVEAMCRGGWPLRDALLQAAQELDLDAFELSAAVGRKIEGVAKALLERQREEPPEARAIRRSAAEEIEIAWLSGQRLLEQRGDRPRLPPGVLAAAAEAEGLPRREVKLRLRFAALIRDRAQLADAIREFGTWARIKSALYPIARSKEDEHEPGRVLPQPE